jgi:mannosyltransferase OCH1-like enzyme
LRYEILYKFGGVYIDADSFITKPEKFYSLLDSFNSDAGFGFEVDYKLACGGVSIAIEGSKFMQKCIEEVPKRDMTKMAWQSIGPQLITDLCIRYKKEIPVHLYPSKTFYPIRWHGIQDVQMHTKIDLPEESVMFQYGYSTNNLETKI